MHMEICAAIKLQNVKFQQLKTKLTYQIKSQRCSNFMTEKYHNKVANASYSVVEMRGVLLSNTATLILRKMLRYVHSSSLLMTVFTKKK